MLANECVYVCKDTHSHPQYNAGVLRVLYLRPFEPGLGWQ